MEQIELNKIKIKDSGVDNSGYSFYYVFKKYNITTIDQLLNDDLMNEVMQHLMKKNRQELKILIEYLKYKYLGIHFTNNDLLNKKPINLEFEISNTFMSDLYVLGLNSETCHNLQKRINALKQDIARSRQMQNKTSPEYLALRTRINKRKQKLLDLKTIDFLRELMDEKNNPENLNTLQEIQFERIRLRIESYEQSNKLTQQSSEEKLTSQQEYDVLVILKDQLFKLIEIRDNLNTQIDNLQQKIDGLSKTHTEGGVNK